MLSQRAPGTFKTLFVGVLVLIGTNSAFAEWKVVHGNSGRIEYPDRTSGQVFKGWGLDFKEGSPDFSGNWVHYDIPGPVSSVRHVQITVLRDKETAVGIQQVDIWNGNRQVQRLTKDSSNRDLMDNDSGLKTYNLDLGAEHAFSEGFGISILVKRTVDGSARIVIVNVKANMN